jgi:glyoxylase-like metal-dependent hydrolase (beta-lactamase superfamily II)
MATSLPMLSAETPEYEVLALLYARRDARRPANFIGGDAHDVPMPLAYYVWVIRDAERTILVDTGFNQDMAVKRHRTLLRTPREALASIGVDSATLADVVITHLHNDHAGTWDDYDAARFHLQDDEMAFATGRHMACEAFARAYEPDHVCGLVERVYANRVVFHDGDAEIAPGVTLHRLGGHTKGLQVVRVQTRRGPVVLASDASHFYEHFQAARVFPLVFHVGDAMQGYRRLRELAASDQHIIPGHDPLVMERYPAEPGLEGRAVRLDADPVIAAKEAA